VEPKDFVIQSPHSEQKRRSSYNSIGKSPRTKLRRKLMANPKQKFEKELF